MSVLVFILRCLPTAQQRAAERKDSAARVAADNPDWATGLLPDDVLRLLPGGEDR